MNQQFLPDLLPAGLRIVFCGTAVGRLSAEVGAYYARPGNRFWSTLAEVGLTPRQLAPQEFHVLPLYGIGLTDLAKKVCGMDADLKRQDYDLDGFRQRIVAAAPRIVAFNGKRAASQFLGVKGSEVRTGLQSSRLGSSILFVLPSTSGAGSRYWDIGPWKDLAATAS